MKEVEFQMMVQVVPFLCKPLAEQMQIKDAELCPTARKAEWARKDYFDKFHDLFVNTPVTRSENTYTSEAGMIHGFAGSVFIYFLPVVTAAAAVVWGVVNVASHFTNKSHNTRTNTSTLECRKWVDQTTLEIGEELKKTTEKISELQKKMYRTEIEETDLTNKIAVIDQLTKLQKVFTNVQKSMQDYDAELSRPRWLRY